MFYQYHVIFYSEWKDAEVHEEGLLYAENWSGAMKELVTLYGSDLCGVKRLEPIDDFLPKDTLDHLVWDLEPENCCELQVSRNKFQKISGLKIFEFFRYKFTFKL